MIDEKKLIKEIKNRRDFWFSKASKYDEMKDEMNADICDGKAMELEVVVKMIQEQPKAGEWVPFTVDEEGILNCELPDEGNEILISGNDDVWKDTFMYDEDGFYLDNWGGDLIGLAWQPLPEPWEGEENGK